MCGIHFENLYESMPSLFWLGILIDVYVAVRWTNMMFVDNSVLKWHCADWFLNMFDMVELQFYPMFSMWNVTNQWYRSWWMELEWCIYPARWEDKKSSPFFPFGSVRTQASRWWGALWKPRFVLKRRQEIKERKLVQNGSAIFHKFK